MGVERGELGGGWICRWGKGREEGRGVRGGGKMGDGMRGETGGSGKGR